MPTRVREYCPECGTPDPPPVKTCASETCEQAFRRRPGGRVDAIYCSRRCAKAQAQRMLRRRANAATEPAS